jgi:hypothetical protein
VFLFLRLLLFVEIFCLLDVIISLIVGPGTIRVSRPLRPAIFLLVDKTALQLGKQCISAERKLRVLALMLLAVVCLWSIMASGVLSEKVWSVIVNIDSKHFKHFLNLIEFVNL